MDEKLILTLIDKFSAGNIGKLELDDGTAKLTLHKESTAVFGIPPAGTAGNLPGSESVHLGLPAGTTVSAVSSSSEFITSPIVATFYSSPSPDAPPFVRPGSKIKAGNSLCILEAMKMMNHLEAEFDCEIITVKAANGDMVEFGQQLFEVKRL